MPGMNNSKIESALLYGVVFLVAVFWFDVRTDDLGEERQVMVPYFPVFYSLIVISSAILASYLSDLYLRDPNRWITFASMAFQPVGGLACLQLHRRGGPHVLPAPWSWHAA
jgi:hypothetical protein